MQTRSKLFKKPNWCFCIILILCGGIFSCSVEDTWYFKERGTLLWIDGRHADKAIKSAIHNTLEHSSIIVAQIPWSPIDSSFFKNAAWYSSLAKDHGKSFMINIDWQAIDRSGTEGGWSFANPEMAFLFKKDMLQLVEAYSPDYINLGVEVNYYALTSADGFRAFASLFRELKKDLKDLNPKLKVGLSYQLELLYGHHKDWKEFQTLTTLDVIYGDIDFLGISTYPNMVIKENDNILFFTNYLDSLVQKYSVPMGISETAASSKLYDENQRGIYVKRIFEKASSLDLKFVIWGSMIDAPKDETWFDKIGLLDMEGNPKREFEIWKSENKKIQR